MIRLTCPSCKTKLAVDDSKAGKSGKCPGCKSPLRIPDSPERQMAAASAGAPAAKTQAANTQTASTSAAITPSAKTPPPASSPRPLSPERARQAIAPSPPRRTPVAVEKLDQLEVIEAEESPPPRRATNSVSKLDKIDQLEVIEDDEPAQDDEPERPQRRKKKKKKRTSAEPIPMVYLSLGTAGVLYVLFLVWAVFARGGSLAMLVVGIPLIAIGQGWFIFIARKEDPFCYLMIRFVPFYSIYYFFTRIQDTLKPFLMGAVGVVFAGTGFIILAAQGAFRIDYDDEWFDDDPPPFVQGNRPFAPDIGDVPPVDRQQLAQDLLARADKAEAKAWLAARRTRSVLEFEPAEARRHIEALYARGAKQVFVADIDTTDPDDERALHLVIVLPDDNRQPLFEYLRRDLDVDDPDTGQKYVVVF